MDAHSDGVPVLVVEVASPTTWRKDVEMDPTVGERTGGGAKAYEYLALGVTEYLVFDPEGRYLPGQVRAWRQSGERHTNWTPDRHGYYRSAELGLAFVPEGLFLRIVDREGRPGLSIMSRSKRSLPWIAAYAHWEKDAEWLMGAPGEKQLVLLRRQRCVRRLINALSKK